MGLQAQLVMILTFPALQAPFLAYSMDHDDDEALSKEQRTVVDAHIRLLGIKERPQGRREWACFLFDVPVPGLAPTWIGLGGCQSPSGASRGRPSPGAGAPRRTLGAGSDWLSPFVSGT